MLLNSLSKSEPRKSAYIPFFWLMRIDQEMNEILRQQSNRTILLDNKTSEWQVKKNKDNAPPTAKKVKFAMQKVILTDFSKRCMVKYCLLSLFHDFFVRDFCLFLSNVERTHVLYF